jgi:type IV secretion system protein VirB4
MLSLREYRNKENAFSDLLNYALMPEDGIVQGKDGSLMASWYFRGEDAESATHSELSVMSDRLNYILKLLGSGWMLHCDAIRRSVVDYPKALEFPDPITFLIDEERRELYESEGVHFETIFALTFTYLPPMRLDAKIIDMLFSDNKNAKKNTADEVINFFKKKITEIENLLANLFKLERMCVKSVTDEAGKLIRYDEQLRYYEYCISEIDRPHRLPSVPMYLDALLGKHVFEGGLDPKIGNFYIKVVSIDGFPHDAFPGILKGLDEFAFEYRWSTRFIFLEPYQARKELESIRKKWQQKQRSLKDQMFNTQKGSVDLDAVEMLQETEQAIALLEAGDVRYGFYTTNIIIMHPDQITLNEQASQVITTLHNGGFGARIESVNAVEAYLGSLPGHGVANIRRPILHTLNLADLLPTTSVWAGSASHPSPLYPKNSPPLCYTSTVGSTPFWLNLHVFDVGHALLAGPTGAGKTTGINFLVAQQFRYKNARVFSFDYKNGLYTLGKACKGDYYDILSNDEQNLSFCPLNDIDTPQDQAWALEWLEMCLHMLDVPVNTTSRQRLLEALRRLATKSSRSLTDFVTEVQDKTLQEALKTYTMDGPLGILLDARTSKISQNRFIVFEMESLMELGNKYTVPTLLYLFRQLEKQLDGRPTFITCDEVWMLLQNPYAQAWLKKSLKTWRSKNAHLLLATQELSDLINSPIKDVIFASCPTQIFLPNRNALSEQRNLYESLQFNEREIELIAHATPKLHYYYRSPLGKRLFSFGFGQFALSFIGANSKDDIRKVKHCITHYGEKWPQFWLQERGLTTWAQRVNKLQCDVRVEA